MGEEEEQHLKREEWQWEREERQLVEGRAVE